MFNLQCPKYLPAASCRKPADGSYFSVDEGNRRRRRPNPPRATWPTCAEVTPGVFCTTLISAVVIYEPAKVFFCRVCVCAPPV